MRLQRILVLCVLLFGFFVMPIVSAYEPAASLGKESSIPDRHQKWDEKIQAIYRQLNLNEQQQKQLADNKISSQAKKKTLYKALRLHKENLNRELMRADLDMKRIDDIQSKIKALQVQGVDDRLNSILTVRHILTAEQFSQFIELMEKMREEKRIMRKE
ncbi:MAG: Spy/CpxP family protein refolding chaperone [Candidatus Omnitrophica bacterium]|nr:Spy/CpxP family protein refolding chaperone [Candidatus Omnitrophota bacterium]